MTKRNENLAKLQAGYLFPEINRRRLKFLQQNPDARVISLGIGNTTEPLTPHVAEGLKNAAMELGTMEGYTGYGDEQGLTALREKIAQVLYKGIIQPEEVFISDGAKCDIGRFQLLFGPRSSIAVQDPSYPVYIDGSVLMGATGLYNKEAQRFDGVYYMPCLPANGFFPDLASQPRTDLIYFCSPNNPTGAVATAAQLKELVDFTRKNRSILIFDAAYSEFIQDADLPRSIYEIDGARDCAIEINSFSKSIGFTGVRLGWSVVPNELRYEDGGLVRDDWNRIVTTIFNGASNLVQKAALAALDPEGLRETKYLVGYYLENARIIKEGLTALGVTGYGGYNSPYIWAEFPGRKSWDIFEEILNRAHIITTPGVGFGAAGESFLRFSAFGHRDNIREAVERLKKSL